MIYLFLFQHVPHSVPMYSHQLIVAQRSSTLNNTQTSPTQASPNLQVPPSEASFPSQTSTSVSSEVPSVSPQTSAAANSEAPSVSPQTSQIYPSNSIIRLPLVPQTPPGHGLMIPSTPTHKIKPGGGL